MKIKATVEFDVKMEEEDYAAFFNAIANMPPEQAAALQEQFQQSVNMAMENAMQQGLRQAAKINPMMAMFMPDYIRE